MVLPWCPDDERAWRRAAGRHAAVCAEGSSVQHHTRLTVAVVAAACVGRRGVRFVEALKSGHGSRVRVCVCVCVCACVCVRVCLVPGAHAMRWMRVDGQGGAGLARSAARPLCGSVGCGGRGGIAFRNPISPGWDVGEVEGLESRHPRRERRQYTVTDAYSYNYYSGSNSNLRRRSCESSILV